jgi:hypothetical protein
LFLSCFFHFWLVIIKIYSFFDNTACRLIYKMHYVEIVVNKHEVELHASLTGFNLYTWNFYLSMLSFHFIRNKLCSIIIWFNTPSLPQCSAYKFFQSQTI